jgi:N-acetylneuraminic acid mutarotase
MFVARYQYGVLERGGAPFLLQYYAKTGPALGQSQWDSIPTAKHLPLDVTPQQAADKVQLTVRWQGEPVAGAEVKVAGGVLEDFTAETNKQGQVEFPASQAGLYSIRARHIENTSGELEGKKYQSIKHYSTLALQVGNPSSNKTGQQNAYPDIPELVTSFGAAIAGDSLYMYGGHTGGAHAYSDQTQADTLYRLPLTHEAKWDAVVKGPRLQGLAMVADGEKLYRLGGFIAQNAEGEEHDLHSQAAAARFDSEAKSWQPLPNLPEPRSSFDAAVLDHKIYVIGGWALSGESDSQWHETAYALDLSASQPQWQALAQPPFTRRALAVAAYGEKIYAIGGMQQEGGPTTKVDIYEPATDKWSEGPALPGEPMEGFGCSAFATGGRLYVSTIGGNLLRLAADGKSWEQVTKLERARFFHRMLPLDDSHLVLVGGASMSEGKFGQVDVIEVE